MSSQGHLFLKFRNLVDSILWSGTPSETRVEAIAKLADTYMTLEREHDMTDKNRNGVVADLMRVLRLALAPTSDREVRRAAKQAISDLDDEDLFGLAIETLVPTESEALVRTAFSSDNRRKKLAAAAAVRESDSAQLFGLALKELPDDDLVHLFDKAATEHARSRAALSERAKSYNKDVFKGQMLAFEAKRREDEARRAAEKERLKLSKVVNQILRL